MTKLSHRYICIMAASCLLLITSVASGEERIWKVASLEWNPYSGSLLEGHGRSVEKLSELLARKNIRLEIEFFPWKRAQSLAKTDEYIGYYPAWPSEVNPGFIASPPIDTSVIAIMKRKDFPLSFTSIDNLFNNYRIGVVSTYVYPGEIDTAIGRYSHHVVLAKDEDILFRMLIGNRTDVAITDPKVMNYIAQKQSNLIETHSILQSEDLVIALRESPETAHRIKIIKQLLSNK
ncbi:ABC transporter substrate-binding protein [Maricurvus nonylphenolicus]|uniref:substrate-binding periplasmic protein n=1 Tax=Maricurvus nonylphenolicus TaxID=1008307 RepID=UPI0036F3377B